MIHFDTCKAVSKETLYRNIDMDKSWLKIKTFTVPVYLSSFFDVIQ